MPVSTLTKEEMLGGFQVCLNLQEELNKKIAGPNWREKAFPWRRAIWLECAELAESFPWKWWAKGKKDPDWDNILIELVDIFHFILSELLEEGIQTAKDLTLIWEDAEKQVVSRSTVEAYLLAVERLVAEAVYFRRPAMNLVHYFAVLVMTLGFSLEDIFTPYIGKNALNEFRQEQGIKKGRYKRNWNGKEDNKVLLEIVKDVPFTGNVNDYKEMIKSELALKYNLGE